MMSAAMRSATTTPRRLLRALCLTAAVALCAPGAAVLLAPDVAHAQDAAPFSYEVTYNVLEGQPVVLRLRPTTTLTTLEVVIKRKKGDPLHVTRSNVAAGDTVELEWEQPAGTHSYQMTVRASSGDGAFDGTTTFEVASAQPLGIEIDFKNVDLSAGKLAFATTRPATRAELAVYGEGKKLIDQVELALDGKGREAAVTWTPTGEQPVLMELKAWDASEAWARIDLFRLEIPHEDVVFDSNDADVRADQVDKLEPTLAAIADALATYDTVAMELYVAGYTDTVGKPDKNIQLSEKRARSIASWFRKKGLSIPVYYQGFGEEVLAVQTGDEVDNESNRRAIYLLTNSAPGVGGAFPRGNWKRVK